MEQNTVEWRIKGRPGLACKLDFGKGKRPEPKVKINRSAEVQLNESSKSKEMRVTGK